MAAGSREDHSNAAAEGLQSPRTVIILIAVAAALLSAMLGQTIVSTAMPRIVADLGGLDHYAWVFAGYMLASTVTIPIYGRLSDISGRRPFFLTGLLLFLVGSSLSGLSANMNQLILFRTIQGLGAGGILPIAQSIVGDLFTPAGRGKWQARLMALFGLAAILGPIAGGWITDNWGWRWVFYVNLPVGVIAFVMAGAALPHQYRRERHAIDYRGVFLLIAAVAPMLLGLSIGGTNDSWFSIQKLMLFAVSPIMGFLFVMSEVRSPEPIVRVDLLRDRVFLVSAVATFLLAAAMYGAIMSVPLFALKAIGGSSTRTGLVLTAMMIGFSSGNVISGQLVARMGKIKPLAMGGFATAACAMGLLAFSRSGVTTGVVIRDVAILGAGIGVAISLFTVATQNRLPRDQLGEATAGVQFFRAMGGTIGMVALGAILSNRPPSELVRGIKSGFVAASVMLTIGLVLTLLLPRNPGWIAEGSRRDRDGRLSTPTERSDHAGPLRGGDGKVPLVSTVFSLVRRVLRTMRKGERL